MMLGFQLLDIISIHALRVEGDHTISWRTTTTRTFLSTPSGWRATFDDAKKAAKDFDFYPRPPGGGRPFFLNGFSHVAVISIHALRVEGDLCAETCRYRSSYFYPRPPGGGRQELSNNKGDEDYFYPRPPGGGRHSNMSAKIATSTFLSTPSGWRATPV